MLCNRALYNRRDVTKGRHARPASRARVSPASPDVPRGVHPGVRFIRNDQSSASSKTTLISPSFLRRPAWRAELLLAATARVATVALLVALAWTGAHWTWTLAVQLSADPPVVVPSERVERPVPSSEAVAALFDRGAGAVPVVPTTLNVKLVGILHARASGSASAAVLSVEGRPNALFAEGAELAPGTRLDKIERDHLKLKRQGVLERLDFPKGAAQTNAAGAFNLQVTRDDAGRFSFSRGALDQALQDPAQLAHLGALSITPGSGATIDQAAPGSLAQKLSLRPGDIVNRVNGEAVTTHEDLLRLYQKFNNTGTVTLEGMRGGAPFKQTYAVNP